MNTIILQEKDLFKCSDLALASVLSTYFPVEAIDKTSNKKAYWLFLRDSSLDEIVKGYYRKEISVEPAAYFERISFLKAMLYSNN